MKPLLAQLDSYLGHVTATVVSCELIEGGLFAVILSQTPFYPGGGGQPADEGSVAGIPVRSVARTADGDVVHILDSEVSGTVEVAVDFARRYDHMQQHTAQHLISAVALERFGWRTTAFHLGSGRSDIELDVPDPDPGSLRLLEKAVNDAVRSCLRVTCRFEDMDSTDWGKVRSRMLPAGLPGPVRIVEIDALDRNTCCGTHVSSTGELQLVKLVGTERLRGGTRTFYVAGHRALGWFTQALERERELSGILTCPPEEHVRTVTRLRESNSHCCRDLRIARKELASSLGRDASGMEDIIRLHRPDGDMDFLRETARVATQTRPGCRGFLTAGAEEDMVFLLFGPEAWAREKGPLLAGILESRGGGAGGLFQGRVGRPDLLDEALRAVSLP